MLSLRRITLGGEHTGQEEWHILHSVGRGGWRLQGVELCHRKVLRGASDFKEKHLDSKSFDKTLGVASSPSDSLFLELRENVLSFIKAGFA